MLQNRFFIVTLGLAGALRIALIRNFFDNVASSACTFYSHIKGILDQKILLGNFPLRLIRLLHYPEIFPHFLYIIPSITGGRIYLPNQSSRQPDNVNKNTVATGSLRALSFPMNSEWHLNRLPRILTLQCR